MFLVVLFYKFCLLYDYFKQCFVQVINFFIDFLWENLVMFLVMFLGKWGNLLEFKVEFVWMIKFRLLLVNEVELQVIKIGQLQVVEVFIFYDLDGVNSLEIVLDNLVKMAIVIV